jgi:hypothetical protein
METLFDVIPAKAGHEVKRSAIQYDQSVLDAGFHRHDEKTGFSFRHEFICMKKVDQK